MHKRTLPDLRLENIKKEAQRIPNSKNLGAKSVKREAWRGVKTADRFSATSKSSRFLQIRHRHRAKICV